jgi:hypothetical protein
MKQPDTGNPCTVHPTSALSPTHHYSDTALSELFTAHVLLFNIDFLLRGPLCGVGDLWIGAHQQSQ